MDIRRRALLALGAIAVSVTTALALSTPAHAFVNDDQECAQQGTGYCLNNWNNGDIGASIKMGQSGWTHQNFTTRTLTTMCNNGHVTPTCPFQSDNVNSQLNGGLIVAIPYEGSQGGCVGSGQFDNRTFLVVCPDSSGNGGGWGSIWIVSANTTNCPSNLGFDAVNRHFTDLGGTTQLHILRSPGATGQYAIADSTNFDGSACWG